MARTLQLIQLLGLTGGKPVHLVCVSPDDPTNLSYAEFAAEFLEAHGTQCKLHPVNSELTPADAVLEQVGAQAHHPVRDLFATSVTRPVLSACPVPVLVGS